MAAPAERLATSVAVLAELQRNGRRVYRSAELTRVHRERLLANGFIREASKGWLIASCPGTDEWDTTPWSASFWEFCSMYCAHRFGDQWHLSPEQSLLLLGGSTTTPRQIVIYTPKGTHNTLRLPFGTSLYDLKINEMPSGTELTQQDGIPLYRPEAALTRVSESFLTRNPIEARTVLSGISDSSDLLRLLLDEGRSTVAGRLAGALRRIGSADLADDIVQTMRAAGYDVRETAPPSLTRTSTPRGDDAAPIVRRLRVMWEIFREPVIDLFPEASGLPEDRAAYLRTLDEKYRSDAYHSLSIEGYRVTPELVERMRSGAWKPASHDSDLQTRDALAARGYWQAFQRVRATIEEIISGGDPAALARSDHRDWYRQLFQPCVAAGLLQASTLAGYRNDAVFLRGSRLVPPRWEAVRDAMPAFFDLLAQEPEPSVRAVLGHWLFGYIHPYPDGNGRIARFLMNAMLASGGYPWTIIPVDDRDAYMSALESASVDADIRPFARFLADRITERN